VIVIKDTDSPITIASKLLNATKFGGIEYQLSNEDVKELAIHLLAYYNNKKDD